MNNSECVSASSRPAGVGAVHQRDRERGDDGLLPRRAAARAQQQHVSLCVRVNTLCVAAVVRSFVSDPLHVLCLQCPECREARFQQEMAAEASCSTSTAKSRAAPAAPDSGRSSTVRSARGQSLSQHRLTDLSSASCVSCRIPLSARRQPEHQQPALPPVRRATAPRWVPGGRGA